MGCNHEFVIIYTGKTVWGRCLSIPQDSLGFQVKWCAGNAKNVEINKINNRRKRSIWKTKNKTRSRTVQRTQSVWQFCEGTDLERFQCPQTILCPMLGGTSISRKEASQWSWRENRKELKQAICWQYNKRNCYCVRYKNQQWWDETYSCTIWFGVCFGCCATVPVCVPNTFGKHLRDLYNFPSFQVSKFSSIQVFKFTSGSVVHFNKFLYIYVTWNYLCSNSPILLLCLDVSFIWLFVWRFLLTF